jgi:prophage DNA circulation protein
MPATPQPGLVPELGDGVTTWADRLREAAYTSPRGTRIRFDYESVSRELDKRTTGFEFPGIDGAYVQDSGYSARKYPLRCYFWGNEHDRIATAFEAALCERGTGRLEHPLYGTFDVVPFGSITRRDDLKTEANQSVVEVTFWTTVGAVYPSGQASPKNEIEAALDGFDVAAAAQFVALMDLRGAVAQANTRSLIKRFLRDVSAAFDDVSSAVTTVNRAFRDLQQTVHFGLDVLVGQPLALAQQMTNLVRAPARAAVGIASRLEAYERLAMRIMGSLATTGALYSTALPALKRRQINALHTADLMAMGAVSGSVASALAADYRAKPDALAAADRLLTQLDQVVAWREARFRELAEVDPGTSYQALQHAVALTAGYLVEASFSLATERRIVLDRPRTIIDLAAELYGSVDDKLDLLIETNRLSGSEILELPRGRQIAYYV